MALRQLSVAALIAAALILSVFDQVVADGFDAYYNVTKDCQDMQGLADRNPPMYANILSIYENGKNAKRYPITDPPTFKTTKSVAQRSYCSPDKSVCEPWYALAATYYKTLDKASGPDQYLAKLWEPALYGTGIYKAGCCGVRTETIKAYSTGMLAAYSMHEIDAALLDARNGTWTKAVEIEDGEAIYLGTPWSASLSKLAVSTASTMCLSSKSCSYNDPFLRAVAAAKVAFAEKDIQGLEASYINSRNQMVALLMRLTLYYSREVSAKTPKPPSNNNCVKKCVKEALLAAARAYYKLLEPIAKSVDSTVNNQIKASLAAGQGPKLQYKTLVDRMGKIARRLGIDVGAHVNACKVA